MDISKKTIIFQDSRWGPTFSKRGSIAYSYRTGDFPGWVGVGVCIVQIENNLSKHL